MDKVENGVFVSVNYTGTLEDGEVFDSNVGRQPLEFKVGAGQMITGFDNAVAGMALDDKKTVTLSPEEAYGAYDESMTRDFPRSDVPSGMDIAVGQRIGMVTAEGHQIPASVTFADEEKVTIDLNHPLAGKSLIFEIEVVGISDVPTQAPTGCGDGCDCSSGCSC